MSAEMPLLPLTKLLSVWRVTPQDFSRLCDGQIMGLDAIISNR
jgi:hypothetical protein